MKIFEYLILFFSFAFTLALTHLLFAITRMIRHRRELVFSVEHALWMGNALLLLLVNWLSLFDFRGKESFDLGSIAVLMVFVITLYFAFLWSRPISRTMKNMTWANSTAARGRPTSARWRR